MKYISIAMHSIIQIKPYGAAIIRLWNYMLNMLTWRVFADSYMRMSEGQNM